MKNQLLRDAEKIHETIVTHRRKIHAMAETGFDLAITKEYVWTQLLRMGYTPRNCGRCGIIADIGGCGKTILLRADMDALPIREETGLDYASPNGSMHACGHDMHSAMLLGAAQLLKDHEKDLSGRVRLMFQSAGEILQGANDMIADRALEGVDAAMMIHIAVGAPLPTGTAIISSPGVSAPAADHFSIEVRVQGCHGCAPRHGVDAITAAAHILIALQEIQSRELGVNEKAVLTIGTFHGVSAPNAIADTATMAGTIRTWDENVRTWLKRRMEDISRGIAAAFRAEADVFYGSGCPCLENDRKLSDQAAGFLKDLLGSNMAFTTQELNPCISPMVESLEDFAYISQQVPSVMVALAAGNPSKGFTYPLHHPKVRFDEDALPYGTAILAKCALQWLNE